MTREDLETLAAILNRHGWYVRGPSRRVVDVLDLGARATNILGVAYEKYGGDDLLDRSFNQLTVEELAYDWRRFDFTKLRNFGRKTKEEVEQQLESVGAFHHPAREYEDQLQDPTEEEYRDVLREWFHASVTGQIDGPDWISWLEWKTMKLLDAGD